MWFSNRRAKWRRHQQIGVNRHFNYDGDQNQNPQSPRPLSPFSEEDRLTPVEEYATSLQSLSPNTCSKSPSSGVTHGAEPLHQLLEEGALNLSKRTLLTPTAPSVTTLPSDHPLLSQQHFFVPNQTNLSTSSFLSSPLSTLAGRPPPPALLPANTLLSRPPLHLSHDLTLTPLTQQYNALAQQINNQQTLAHSSLSHAQALSIISSIHMAQAHQTNLHASPAYSKDENPDSDIEVTDPEDAGDVIQHQKDFSKVTRDSEEEVQDLSVKKRKIEIDGGDVRELQLTTSISESNIASLPTDFLEMICRNNSRTECK